MAVLPDYQKQGIGSELIKQGICAVKQLGHPLIIVLGHAGYYPKFGFLPASKFGLKSTYEAKENVFMAMTFSDLSWNNKIVHYRDEFKSFDV